MQTWNLQTWPASNRVFVTSILDTTGSANVPELPTDTKTEQQKRHQPIPE
jgi:hypothetical protein